MLVSVAPEHSEAAFVEDSVGGDSVVVGCEVDSGVVCVGDSKARGVLVVISLKTYTRITPAPTNSRLVGYEWMVTLALPLGLPLNSAAVAVGMGVVSMRSPANR
jgi:hypothetical protein